MLTEHYTLSFDVPIETLRRDLERVERGLPIVEASYQAERPDLYDLALSLPRGAGRWAIGVVLGAVGVRR